MPMFKNEFEGSLDTGEQFIFGWWMDSSEAIDGAHTISQDWIAAFWTGGYDAFCTPGVEVTQVRTREVSPATGGQSRLRETVVSHPGVEPGDSMSPETCIVVSLRTDLANRSGRGRFYLPQPAEITNTAEGRISSGTVDGIVSALTNAWQAVSGLATPVVYSRTMGSHNDVVRFNVGDLYDTQRRRQNDLTESRSGADMPS